MDLAVKAAKDAFAFGSPWRSMSASKRALLINAFADLIQRDSLYIAVSVQHMFCHSCLNLINSSNIV